VSRILAVVLAGAVVALLLGWAVVHYVNRPPAPALTTAQAQPSSTEPGRRIGASLFFVSEDGMRLVTVDREVPYAPTPIEQARIILAEQLGPAPEPYAQAIPEGTTLRAVFVTTEGDAYVDLSKDVTSSHPGGSLDEAFSVYALVNAITVNLPAIGRVQILVEGHEVDTLAGHIDLRQPLRKDLRWIEAPAVPGAPPAPDGAPAR
jgi:spore germination protein GerM